jgi:DNA-directed RNA polymerase subunit beta'
LGLRHNSHQMTVNVKIGDYVHCGDKIGEFFGTPLIIGDSGRVITLTKTQLTLQKTQPVLFYSEATSHVRENEWVQRGSPILTLTHQTLVTGDIVQGIPRIEQLFEAVTSSSSALPDDEPLYETLHSQAREIFRRNWSKVPLPTAVRQALEEIQQIIVESIQKVYLSQGVLIADKHIEIIVKQMTSKGQIIDNGNTGFIINEVLPLQKIENANLTTAGKKAVYAPAVVGLTRAALNSDSFVSAASFQETTRVLTRDAVAGKSDFLRGLKEKVVIGDLISAGTGLDLFFLYTLLAENIFDPTCEKMSGLRKPRLNRYESSIRRI